MRELPRRHGTGLPRSSGREHHQQGQRDPTATVRSRVDIKLPGKSLRNAAMQAYLRCMGGCMRLGRAFLPLCDPSNLRPLQRSINLPLPAPDFIETSTAAPARPTSRRPPRAAVSSLRPGAGPRASPVRGEVAGPHDAHTRAHLLAHRAHSRNQACIAAMMARSRNHRMQPPWETPPHTSESRTPRAGEIVAPIAGYEISIQDAPLLQDPPQGRRHLHFAWSWHSQVRHSRFAVCCAGFVDAEAIAADCLSR